MIRCAEYPLSDAISFAMEMFGGEVHAYLGCIPVVLRYQQETDTVYP